MTTSLLIANRGEIAIRIAQAAFELNIETFSIYSEDDLHSLHLTKTDQTLPLKGSGPQAYLDGKQIIDLALGNGCKMIHPGYGFLSENADFAQQCLEAGITFVGPSSEILTLLGDKSKAKALAVECGVPIIPGISHSCTLEETQTFFQSLGEGEQMLIKAIAGGGGRGMRLVKTQEEVEIAYTQCQSEAMQAFGKKGVYVEKYLPKARHIEIQIIGDGTGEITSLGERECSIQRNHQKIIEYTPCLAMSEELRGRIISSAVKMAKRLNYTNAGTFEFLAEGLEDDSPYYFIESNPRLQVEHTVTEEVYGIDLVKFQLRQARGKTLTEQKLTQNYISHPKGVAIQLRVNAETLAENGKLKAEVGILTHFSFPFGKSIRIDSFGYTGYQNNPRFDSLIAKVILHLSEPDFPLLTKKAYKTLAETHIEGIKTNLPLLKAILQDTDFQNQNIHTKFVSESLSDLLRKAKQEERTQTIFNQDSSKAQETSSQSLTLKDNEYLQKAPMPGNVLSIDVKVGDIVTKGQSLMIMEAMKMESVILAPFSGVVNSVEVSSGQIVAEDQALIVIEKTENAQEDILNTKEQDLDYIRPDLSEMQKRKAFTLDENRPEAVAKRRKYGQYTARENISALCDEDSFKEYGSLIIAAQRRRRKLDDLIQNTPADGLITGIGSVNREIFGEENAQCMIMAYDYTVLAGTQGTLNHKKMDRMLHIADEWKIPLVIFAEGGGGRPGDTDYMIVAGLDVMTFSHFARLSGKVPRVSIVSRYCFAGNAALAGCSDVIIATENTSIGMGGPAMIEGGGLGSFHPQDVGPASFQVPNGVIDILVKDEMEAVDVAKKYISYFQGRVQNWECADQRLLRSLIPENRRRVYDIRKIIHTLADTDSVLELRSAFGQGMITALIRIEGRPIGLIANNPMQLGGAIDADGADKAARFMQLCNAFEIPILSLCDTPGIMVGPEAEKQGTVRHASRLFVVGSHLRVPYFTIVLRKGYGLGAQAMAGGSFDVSFFTIAWPTGEFGAMGLEGAVKLGYRKELEKAGSPEEQQALFEKMVAKSYEMGKAISAASFFEMDEVIDPKDSRAWVIKGLNSAAKKDDRGGSRFIDTW